MPEVYPSTLPGVLLSSVSVVENQAFRSNDADIGPPTYELLSENVPTAFNVQWLFYPFDFQVFENWFKHSLTKGVKSFTIDLPVGAGVLEHECNFTAPYTASRNGELTAVSATLRAIAKQFNTEAQFDNLLLLSALFDDLDKERQVNLLVNFVNVVLPDFWENLDYPTDYS